VTTIRASELSELCGVRGEGDAFDVVGGLSVGAGELADHDALVRQLDSDVTSHPQPPFSILTPGDVLPHGNPAFVTWKVFVTEWHAYALAWSRWFTDHQTILSQSGTDVGSEFAQFQGQYNELLRRFEADFQGKTGASRSTSSFWDGVPWTKLCIVGGVVLAFMLLPSYLPILAGSLALRR
jgi:hypothetical protein